MASVMAANSALSMVFAMPIYLIQQIWKVEVAFHFCIWRATRFLRQGKEMDNPIHCQC